MEINECIINYIHNPFPLWDEKIVNLVIDYKWKTSLQNIFLNLSDYSIAGCVLTDSTIKEQTNPLLMTGDKIAIAFPSDSLSDFYNEHGLVPADINNLFAEKIAKINGAIKIFETIQPLKSFLLLLVKSVQILESNNTDIDISYSNPKIPLSIFFSLCDDNSIISDLRVAESILHESMHLYLTLIENIYPMVKPSSKDIFYSPWRNEERPLQGVLHGLFVFRTILDFYTVLLDRPFVTEVYEYLLKRVYEIKKEIQQLANFPKSKGLTVEGQKISSMLLL